MDENIQVPQQDETGEFGKLFRTAFRGFHKQDVIECIARLTRDKNREKEADEIRIRELTQQCDQLTEDLNAARKINADLTAQLYQARADREAAQAELTQEKASIDRRIRTTTQTLEAAVARKDAQIAELSRSLDTAQQLAIAVRAQTELVSRQADAAKLAAQYFSDRIDAAVPTAAPEAPVKPENRTEAPRTVHTPTSVRTGSAAAQSMAENAQKKLIKGVNSLLSKILND